MKKYYFSCLLILLAACQNPVQRNTDLCNKIQNFAIYSAIVKDTFNIFVSTPPGYDDKKLYPVVYLLDANLYFDILAPAIKKYTELGGVKPCILVGIGYKDFNTMDSLRSRDYTYPKALPRYEMAASGQADLFLTFISKELKPYIRRHYSGDTAGATLLGHSLGGYFTLYALYQRLARRDHTFSTYIAASPSLDYNNQYITHQFASLDEAVDQDSTRLYLTFGGLEDSEDADDTSGVKTGILLDSFSVAIRKCRTAKIIFKADTFSSLGHMDTPYPTFTKGLFWAPAGN
ncbi:MAG: alpha/beta hydrolase [Bacteroidetes bacterium]|nr:alpha/beta hydrolase [Bacteroidota bacterium]